MNTGNKILFNTIILYVKMLVVMAINLLTVPLLLRTLGQSDYGLYQLIAGVVVMLSFLNAAMTVSTQRFMSVSMGEGDEQRMNTIYNVSLVLHLIIACCVAILLEASMPLLFNYVLNIAPCRIVTAKIIYQSLIASTFFTIMAVPYDAVLNSYENMVVFAVINIIESLLRLGLVFSLLVLPGDRLIIYGAGMAGITLASALAKNIYTRKKYPLLWPCREAFDKNTFKQMLGFSGWNTFSSFALAGRNQGIAIILNMFMGTVVNAAYGIANQINALLVYFGATLQKSINPQLMKSEGMHDRQRVLRYSYALSKVSVVALSILAIPLIIEMPYVLSLWLGEDIPNHTIEFTRCILAISMLYQLSSGLMSAVQSHGVVRNYTIVISITLLLNLPLAYLILWLDWQPAYVLYGMFGIEILCLIVRMYFAKHLSGVDTSLFLREVIIPLTITIIVTFGCLWSVTILLDSSFIRLCLTCVLDVAIFCPLAFYIVLNSTERDQVMKIIQPYLSKFRHKKNK